MPGKATVAVASLSCWAQVRTVDMCRSLIDEYVQVDAIVCPLDHADHELEAVAAFLVDVDGPPALCPFLKVA